MARNLLPVFVDLVDRQVVVVGGGRVATTKTLRLLEAGARVTVVAPHLAAELEHLPVTLIRRRFEPADLDTAWYVVSAAPPDVNAHVVAEGTRRRVFVNAVDDPAHASAFAGSGFTRGPVTIAISTGGEAPALARVMRQALEQLVGPDVEDWTSMAASLRGEWRRSGVAMEARRDALLEAIAHLHRETVGSFADSRAGGPRPIVPHAAVPKGNRGFVSLVGAGPGDPQLLTRLGARRLAEADLVLYDALVPAATVSLAVNAQRILVGRRRGSETIGQEAINRTLVRAARRGRRVVRLKGGDPFVFGRGGEEALSLAQAGVAFEVVPGVSSALAAPGLASIPITHRGLSGAVMITTAHDADRFRSLIDGLAPAAATLVVMMGTAHRGAVSQALIDAGWRASTPAAIVWNASLRDQAVWTGSLDTLSHPAAPGDAPGTIIVGDVVAVRDTLHLAVAPGVTTRPLSRLREEVRHARAQ
jgi:uroporphyrin-III C-methyltransferase / precorrin-2 dehydrogenase / sirohydrochlorin ferrochelatase